MNFPNRRITASLFLALILVAFAQYSRAVGQATNGGRLRLVHAVPDAPAADISIDNVVAARGLAFASATRYLMVTPGDHAIVVSAGGSKLYQGKVTVSPAQALTVVLQGTASAVESAVYEDDLGPVAAGNIRLTAIHAVKDGPAVDVLRADGSPLIQGLKYGAPYGGFDIPVAALSAVVVPAGGDVSGALVKTDNLPLVAGTYNVLLIAGTVNGSTKPSYLLLSAPTDTDKPAANVFVSFVHAASAGKPIDIYVGGKLIVPGLAYGSATPHVALDAKAADVVVRAAGSAADSAKLASFSLSGPAALAGGAAGTLVITGAVDGSLSLQLAPDNTAALDSKIARLNLINAAGGSATLKVGNKALVSDTKANSSDIPAGTYDLTVTVDKPSIQLSNTLPFSGGVLYDLVVAGDAQNSQLIVAAMGLNEQPSSAPAGSAVAVAQANTPGAATPAATQAVGQAATQPASQGGQPSDTPAPTLVSAPGTQASTEAAQPTEAPAATQEATTAPAATDTPVPPTVVPGIVGVVNVNEGVNLKIREYPGTDARTLALVPKDGTLNVLGVRGPNVAGTPTVSKVTPTSGPTATLSAEGVTVDAIWLYVSWTVPTGGTVTGWVNAQFVELTRNGKPVRNVQDILNFKEIPPTTAGEVNSAAVTPVSQTSQVLGTVTVNQGSNLQLRRTPDIQGESLALVPAGAQVIVLQQLETNPQGTPVSPSSNTTVTPVPTGTNVILWLFVRYQTDTGAVDGWVNSQFLTLTKNGRKADLNTEVPVAKDITRGFLEGGATAVKPPTPPGIVATVNKVNQGANLQLRRNPDATSESLGLIPGGSELQVEGRNADGSWIKVKYNDLDGWINAQFVTLTKNGRPYKIADVTNISGQPDVIGLATPGPSLTPSPSATPHP